MGGCTHVDECEITPAPLTLVLVGRTGNGKSATGNSLVGSRKFESKRSSSGVTTTSQLKTTVLEDGRILNVIDTPGLFDSSVDHEFIAKEIVRCVDLARDGIQAVLVVFSACNRFSEEEKSAISSLLTLFGRKIYDYIIVVFTGGDELEDEGKTLEDFLCGCQEALKETLHLCGNRYVLFDNKTKDETKRSRQLQNLLDFVNIVSLKNGGRPYTNELFSEFKKCTRENEEQEMLVRGDQFKRILEMVESKLKVTNLKLEQLLEAEQAARVKAEKKAKAAENKANEYKEKMKKETEKTKKGKEEMLRKRAEERRREEAHWKHREEELRRQAGVGCVIL